mmetsp:Transcript_30824/g.66345  ORF Transcript_30824/g.66345 Transcript_30824/m.66345 type:complete len:137 (-) Transcript_30824:647-1057(-)
MLAKVPVQPNAKPLRRCRCSARHRRRHSKTRTCQLSNCPNSRGSSGGTRASSLPSRWRRTSCPSKGEAKPGTKRVLELTPVTLTPRYQETPLPKFKVPEQGGIPNNSRCEPQRSLLTPFNRNRSSSHSFPCTSRIS